MNNKSVLKDPPTNEKDKTLPVYKEGNSCLLINKGYENINEESSKEDSVVDTNKRKEVIVKNEVPAQMKKSRVSLKSDENDSDIEVLGKVNHVTYASIRSENSLFFHMIPEEYHQQPIFQ